LPTSPKDFADLPREDFLGVLCEGTVLRIPKALPPAMLERLFNREEGEPIPNALITVKP
jgi:hypothetical protein